MWLVTQIAPFVCGDTGSLRDLDYLTWDVRFTKLLQLSHWKLRNMDVWTVPPAPPAAEEAARLLNVALTVKPQM